MSILDQIAASKRAELEAARAACPLDRLKALAGDAPPPRGFRRALLREDVAVIAEVKRKSPSKGTLREDFEPVEIARSYQAGGASALSVLTDEPYFGGSLEALRRARGAVALPVLRKDFTVDPYQVYEARAAGADAVLLIVAILDYDILARLYHLTRELEMDALVEVHTEEEMEWACRLGADLVGINNRNLRTFDTSLETTTRLAAAAPKGALLTALSGITSRKDVEAMARTGARAVLVGETLMRRPDIEQATRELVGVKVDIRSRISDI